MSRVLARDIISAPSLLRTAPTSTPPTILCLSSWTTVRDSFPSAPTTQNLFAPTHHSTAPARRVVGFQHSSLSPFSPLFPTTPNIRSLSMGTETPASPFLPDSPLSFEPASEDRRAPISEES
jgi:hypothetical protein